MVVFGFSPKFFGGGEDLPMVLCHSMNAGSVAGIPRGIRVDYIVNLFSDF